MQVHGEIQTIGETQEITEKFSKREFVLLIDLEKPYPQPIQFELHNDKCDIIDAYQEGQRVSVDFELKGRQWDKGDEIKTFNTLKAWKIQPIK